MAPCPSAVATLFELLQVEHVLVYANDSAESREDTHMVPGRDAFWQDVIPQQASTAGACPKHCGAARPVCWYL